MTEASTFPTLPNFSMVASPKYSSPNYMFAGSTKLSAPFLNCLSAIEVLRTTFVGHSEVPNMGHGTSVYGGFGRP